MLQNAKTLPKIKNVEIKKTIVDFHYQINRSSFDSTYISIKH